MSRVAKQPIELPKGVEFKDNDGEITVKGPKGALSMQLHPQVSVAQDEQNLQVAARSEAKNVVAMAGTTRALIANMAKCVSEGFERKLQLVGVGYRAQVQGKDLNLTLGFSHPVTYPLPEGISIETPSQTEIVIKGIDKQRVGQVAAEIRQYRPPEPYKGKGVRYAEERVVIKEAKKK
jgi:large subunit ribosomal protein L6